MARRSQPLTQPLLDGSILKQQLDLENQSVRDGVIRYRRLVQEAIDRGDGAALKPAERLLIHWLHVMVEAINEERRACKRCEFTKGRRIYAPVLLALESDRTAVVTIHEMLGQTMAESYGIPVIRIAYAIGRACLAELNHDLLSSTKENRKVYKELTTHIRRITPRHVNWWAKKQLDDPIWSKRVCIHLGAALMWLLLGVASTRSYKDDDKDFNPAFQHVTIRRPKKVTKLIRLDQEVCQIIEQGHEIRQTLRPVYMPMIVQPYPWAKAKEGGYLCARTPLVAKACPRQIEAMEQTDLRSIHSGVNAVNAAPWRVNQPVLDVVRKIWDSGGGKLEVPHADDLPIPPFNPDRIDDWKAEAREQHKRNEHIRAERQVFLERLMVADKMPDRFYFPHFLDFRSRCYPIPPHLTHHGDDVCRGLLEWSDAKPKDSQWVELHTADSWENGIDKMPWADKRAWVQSNIAMIKQSAQNPLECTWWEKAGKPFQFLAGCCALLDEGPCRLPIRTDGTCNGLQHYAALGRSIEDASVVNMVPGPAPVDAYTIVAEHVKQLVGVDADAGNERARLVLDLISRVVVKQTVMTKMYDVTMVGARKQVLRQLEKLGVEGDDLYKCSFYLSRLVMKAVNHICHSASDIMDWLRTCAQAATKTGEAVQWTTPLGFPVVQPYRNYRSKAIQTILQNISAVFEDGKVPISVARQIRSFSPNFVHSLDASHMLMTASSCHRSGLTFAAVHDAYYSHSADMDKLSKILRTQFVKLHTPPLMDLLVADLRGRYKGVEFPDPPPRGEFDLAQVMDSRYFF